MLEFKVDEKRRNAEKKAEVKKRKEATKTPVGQISDCPSDLDESPYAPTPPSPTPKAKKTASPANTQKPRRNAEKGTATAHPDGNSTPCSSPKRSRKAPKGF